VTRTFFSSKILDYTDASRLKRRFEYVFMPTSDVFNPIPAAECLLDPAVGAVVLARDLRSLLHAAKLFIVSLAETNTTVQRMVSHDDSATDSAAPSALKKCMFPASRMTEQSTILLMSAGSNISTTLVLGS
jgi:hypothetical protein